MCVISNETWSKLTKEEQDKLRKDYADLLRPNGEWLQTFNEKERSGALFQMRWIFGEENLKSTPKTWEELIELSPSCGDFEVEFDVDCKKYNIKPLVRNAMLATHKLTEIIEAGYGGVPSDDEMRDPRKDIFNVFLDEEGKCRIGVLNTEIYDLIVFRSLTLAEEFISHKSNQRLVRDYFMYRG